MTVAKVAVFFYTVVIMSDIFNKLLVLRTPRIGPAKYNELISKFGSADAVVDAIGVGDDLRDSVAREMGTAARLGITYICDSDALYPAALREIKNHPPIITARGNLETLRRHTVGIVGTRHATAAGISFVSEIAREFATRGIAVVSGMAIGTDSAAHRGALRANGDNQTIAVLGGGADYIWPIENESLYYEILERGVVVSEMPVGFVPTGSNFVVRNRWIAGIAEKLILGEADLKSGSMTTARFAIETNRELWAIPSHPADSRSMGPNSLIASGAAKLCMGIGDFYDGNKKQSPKSQKVESGSESENDVLDKLGTIPVSESVLTQIVKKSVSEIKRDLVVLELRGIIKKVDGGYIKL
jgi:DNA processing protein